MLILPNSSTEKLRLEPPPDYTDVDPSPQPGSSSHTQHSPFTPQTPSVPSSQATNFLLIVRDNKSVKETFTIDPQLQLPQQLLPPIPVGTLRKNLAIECKNGRVDVDVVVLNKIADGSEEATTKRLEVATEVSIESHNGSVAARLYAENVPRYTKAVTTTTPRPPIHLSVVSKNGPVSIYIPRTFHGIVIITTDNGKCKPPQGDGITLLGESNKISRFWLGELIDMGSEWSGDRIEAHSHNGNAQFGFLDELSYEPSKVKAGKGFFANIFGP